MSGSIIGGVVGATIGFFVGGPTGAVQGWAIGSAIGGVLMPGDLPPVEGPRLDDLKVQSSEYGRAIPIVYGTAGIAGNVIWASDIIEVKTTTEQGGKGGGGQEVTEYTYFGNFAVALCDGPIGGVLRIWAGPEKRLIYDGFQLEGGTVRIYLGDDSQMPDPLIEQYEGAGNVPAYRGTAYVVFENYPLINDGNRLPFLTFEVGNAQTCPVPASTVSVGGITYSIYDPAPIKVCDTADAASYGRAFGDAATGLIYYTYRTGAGAETQWWIDRTHPSDGYVGPPLLLGSGIAELRIAWNGEGAACAVQSGQTGFLTIDLDGWSYGASALIGEVWDASDPPGKADVAVALSDVAWDGNLNEFRFLSLNNSLSAYPEMAAINDVDTALARNGYGLTVKWGSIGSRFGGSLLPIGTEGAAASFSSQPSNFASEAVTWQAYDSKRNRLISFTDGAYSNPYTNTSDFGFSSDEQCAVYSPRHDRFFVVRDGNIYIYHPDNLTPETWPPEDCILFHGRQAYEDGTPINVNFRMRVFLIPSEPNYLGVLSGAGEIFKIYIGIERSGVALSEIVADLCDRAGVTNYDVSELTDTVDGYVIAKQTDIRGAIDALRPAYYFDAVESQGEIRFVKRGSATVTEIDDDDLAAHMDGSESGDQLRTTRIQEVELPRVVTVSYIQAATDYTTATKTAKRLVGSSEQQLALEMPLVLSDTKAQEVAEVNLHAAWAQRLLYEFSIPSHKYSELEPTDLVLVKGNLMRIMKVTATPFGILRVQAVSDDSFYYAPHVVVTETVPIVKNVYTPGETILAIM